MKTKEKRQKEIDEKYEKELNKMVLISYELPRIQLRELIAESHPNYLLQGRHCIGVNVKINKKTEEKIEINKYKITSYEIVLRNGFRYKISSFLFKELKKRFDLNIEYYNCW